ncbi:MAG: AmmeMemoRadiSam system radical SAM enzyme [Pseudomonadota bacterium]
MSCPLMSTRYSRREFLTKVPKGICALGIGSQLLNVSALPNIAYSLQESETEPPLKEVIYYEKLGDQRIQCKVCPKECKIADLERGYCGNKENRGGKYYTLVHSRPCAIHVDPIEKKPLFHYLPSTPALSLATAGCNFECKFCQNWNIAQFRPEQVKSYHVTPEGMVGIAKRENCPTIAYTYSEPVVFYEYMYDIAELAKKQGIGSVMISNGFINKKPLVKLCEHLSAVKIDLKAFTERFYRESCSGELRPVLDTLETLREIGIWYEIVVLIIPTLNDSEQEIREMSLWIKNKLGPDVPIHFSRFHPAYKIRNLPPTPVRTLERARKIGRETGLNYVYIGNVPGHEGESTYCPKCGKVPIRRVGYTMLEMNLKSGKCGYCNNPIPGVWKT